MRVAFGAAVLAGLLGTLVLPAVANADVSGPPPGALVVGTAGPGCASPGYSTITAALTAATDGDTIYVCVGTYAENLSITKNVTLIGAQHGQSAASPRSGGETVLAPTSGDAVTYRGPATGGTIDGFTIHPAANTDGVVAVDSDFTGFDWENNIFDGPSNSDLHFKASGPATTIANNSFANQANGGEGAVFFSNGVANGVSITDNVFNGNAVDINTTGLGNDSPGGGQQFRSTGLVVSHNTSTNQGNFLVLFLTSGAQITGNSVLWPDDPTSPDAQTAIYISGGNTQTLVQDNTVGGGAATGISINNQFYSDSPSTSLTVSGNTITNRSNGIRVAPSSDPNLPTVSGATISNNVIQGSGPGSPDPKTAGFGLWMAGGADLSITGNTVDNSTFVDCRDDTTGNGTAGTANTWTGDTGGTSDPDELCSPPEATSSPASSTTATTSSTNTTSGTTSSPETTTSGPPAQSSQPSVSDSGSSSSPVSSPSTGSVSTAPTSPPASTAIAVKPTSEQSQPTQPTSIAIIVATTSTTTTLTPALAATGFNAGPAATWGGIALALGAALLLLPVLRRRSRRSH